jgi:hypothetical protein
MKPIWEMTETEKVELATRIILRVAENPDGMTVAEIEADGIRTHSSFYLQLCRQGLLIRDYRNRVAVFKIPDGKDEINSLQASEKMI